MNARSRSSRKKRNETLFFAAAVLILTLILIGLVALLSHTVRTSVPVQIGTAGYAFSPQSEPKGGGEPTPVAEKSAIGVWDDELYSSNAILINNTTSEILFVKDAYAKIYPASITKVMTAILAIENIPDLNAEITLSDTMFQYIIEQNASVAGFSPNETVTARDMLYALLLPSGADAAIGLAMYLAGDETTFAALMNTKAKEIGMENTHFVNATGLHDDGHYSTVYDLALMLRYALTLPLFRQISSTETYTTTSTKYHYGGLVLTNTLFANLKASGRKNNFIAGGKTGYTYEALQCLASYAEKESNEYILVTVGAGEDNKKKQEHILDALTVYADYAD